MRATIKDIAKKSGFSVTTVSLVLNNKATKIPYRTIKIIKDTAREMDYRPNQLAVSMVTKRTNSIGLIISDVSNAFFARMTKIIEGTCLSLDWNLILCDTNDSHDTEIKYIEMLMDKGIDGIIFSASYETGEENGLSALTLLHQSKVPFVLVDRYVRNCCCPAFTVDNILGGYLATKHLCEIGHREIAVITGPMSLKECRDRLAGYKKALKEFLIEYNEDLVYNGDFSCSSGKCGIDYLDTVRYTAVFAFNDIMALGAYSQLRNSGRNVPQDISLVGYDDVFPEDVISIPLTSVHQPVEKIGSEAVRTLVSLLNNNEICNEEVHIFEPTLSVKGTTRKVNTFEGFKFGLVEH